VDQLREFKGLFFYLVVQVCFGTVVF